MSQNARLVIVCGLPGAGKTTLAKELVAEMSAIRFSPDEWMEALDIDLYDEAARSRIEGLQWEVAQALLRLGSSVVIEWGTWSRCERDKLREVARELGAGVELHYLDEPIEVLWRRLKDRGAESPVIQRSDLEAWSEGFDVPSSEELSLYDPPIRRPGDRSEAGH